MNLKRFMLIFLLATGTTLFCIGWVDRPVALILNKALSHAIAARTGAIPDLLLPIALTISAASWMGYGWLTWRNRKSPLRPVLAAIGLASLLSFAAKCGLQTFFGRLNPRQWLASTSEAQFHILGADGIPGAFPSGHMSVFTPIFIALYRIFPWLSKWWFLLWVALALALIVGNYHFVSDVLAGAYLGFLVDLVCFTACCRFVGRGSASDSGGICDI